MLSLKHQMAMTQVLKSCSQCRFEVRENTSSTGSTKNLLSSSQLGEPARRVFLKHRVHFCQWSTLSSDNLFLFFFKVKSLRQLQ